MGESNDSINGILLEAIDEKTAINFSLLATPIKDTPSIGKTSAIYKIKNYIDKSHDKAAKIQLKQAILREVKQELPNETKKDTLMNFFTVFTINFLHLKVKLAF